MLRPKPAPGGVGAVPRAGETPENVAAFCGGNAASIVADLDAGEARLFRHRDLDGAAARREFQCVVDEIGDRFAHQVGIALADHGAVGRKAKADALAFGERQEELMQFRADRGEIDVGEGACGDVRARWRKPAAKRRWSSSRGRAGAERV